MLTLFVSSSAQPSRLGAWFLALRPKTLLAALAPVCVAGALADETGRLHRGICLAAWLGASALQAGANLYNDYADAARGADTPDRLGPKRATAEGWLAPHAVRNASGIAFLVATGMGLYLLPFAPVVLTTTGLTAIAVAVAYTGGPYPLAYLGLGDLFAFLFFGPVAVGVTYYLQAGRPSGRVWLASCAMGLWVAAILVVNNLRDRQTDARVGKKTLAVRFGARFSRAEYVALTLAATFAPWALYLLDPQRRLSTLVPLAIFPATLFAGRAIFCRDGRRLNIMLGATAQLALGWALCFALGRVWERGGL